MVNISDLQLTRMCSVCMYSMKVKYANRPNDGGLQIGLLFPTDKREGQQRSCELSRQRRMMVAGRKWGRRTDRLAAEEGAGRHRDTRSKGSRNHADQAGQKQTRTVMEGLPSSLSQ